MAQVAVPVQYLADHTTLSLMILMVLQPEARITSCRQLQHLHLPFATALLLQDLILYVRAHQVIFILLLTQELATILHTTGQLPVQVP